MYPCSPLCLRSELDHFSVPPTETAIESAKYVSYSPFGNNLTSSSATWEIASTPDEAVDLAHSSLSFDVCV